MNDLERRVDSEIRIFGKTLLRWRCDGCAYTCTAADRAYVRSQGVDHIKRLHPSGPNGGDEPDG